MKFSATLLLAALPLLSEVALAAPGDSTLVARQQRGRQRGGNAAAAAAAARRQRGQQRGGRNGGNGGVAAGGAAAGGAAAGGAAAGGAAAGGATQASSSAAPVATTGQGANQGQGNNNAGNGAAAGNGGNNNAGNGGAAGGNNGDPQESTQLDPKVICKGFEQDGQAVPVAGQVSSLTSKNNFVNHCLLFPNLALTDGKQIQAGSCNPAPIGVIPSVDNQPTCKFIFPQNTGTVKSNTAFTVQMAIKGIITGNFVNAQTNYFAAPQQVKNGLIVGHTHVVIQKMASITDATPLDPKVFQFFKGVNGAAVNGVVTADVPAPGLPDGAYRMCSINTSANHTPAIGPVAQHGSFDDCTYFTATADGPTAAGQAAGNNGANAGNNAGNAGNNAGNAGNNAGNGANAGNNAAAGGNAGNANAGNANNNGGRRGGRNGN